MQLGLLLAAGAGEAPAPDAAAVPGGRRISFEIPGDPRAKGRPKTAVIHGHAVVYTPAATRAEERTVRAIAAEAMAGRPPLEGPVAISIAAHMAIPASWSRPKRQRALAGVLMPTTKPDIDNVAKLVKDALNSIVYRDDSQVVQAELRKTYAARPRVEVTVVALHAEAA